MKSFLIVFILALLLANTESNTYNLQIKELLSQDICTTGLFILDAELNMPIKDSLTDTDTFFQYF